MRLDHFLSGLVLSSSLTAILVQDVHGGNWDWPQTAVNKQTLVHLFEWKWTDIAKECEDFLQYYDYGAVQISPPMEHIHLSRGAAAPWWNRYQPVSYLLESRSGNRAEFIDMVNRCNAVGVRIIADVVVNHMTYADKVYGKDGIGDSGNTPFHSQSNSEYFPNVPYDDADYFHDRYCSGCGANCLISNSFYQNNAWGVRMCRLDTLVDLDQSNPYVRGKIVDYLNDMSNIGVAGFRFDAAKHMWPTDLCSIMGQMKNLNETIFGKNAQPFCVGEVIDTSGTEAIKGSEYTKCGRITNFKYGLDVAGANFKYFGSFGPKWDFNWANNDVLNFIDNHDNQRHDPNVLTYKNPSQYQMGVTFMLAWTYGYPRTSSPAFNRDRTCQVGSGWVCEHRWPAIARMVQFRAFTAGAAVTNTVTGEHRIAFGRQGKGFFAVNNNGQSNWIQKFQTSLPTGQYCDVISGEYDPVNAICTGALIEVLKDGSAHLFVPKESIIAIHGGAKVNGEPFNKQAPVPQFPPVPELNPTTSRPTVIFLHKQLSVGQDLFIRGGIDTNYEAGLGKKCPTNNGNLPGNKCAIRAVHKTQAPPFYAALKQWRIGDNYLDWNGHEPGQGTWNSEQPEGTPMCWSTNDQQNLGYQSLNKYGPDYWLVEFNMDCSQTVNGWFEFKGYVRGGGGFEGDISQSTCTGTLGGAPSYAGGHNHYALCGAENVFEFGAGKCIVNKFTPS